ncbi:hypothetical protein NADFUDRAFT_83547 [Nadsonia fulvescens var. elongata DSM 6958]|uniref:Uncharacterized protein n=1 Tax=Nadsonia fulvescens var. elongata DSM 6958 TaxID=857566 RepID=A0A1E3PI29_9ASCO|nr:hypothetical protein NADFUDRAFT_83547 [Nadsonia fulvescens var. elongata DSM 6958]
MTNDCTGYDPMYKIPIFTMMTLHGTFFVQRFRVQFLSAPQSLERNDRFMKAGFHRADFPVLSSQDHNNEGSKRRIVKVGQGVFPKFDWKWR